MFDMELTDFVLISSTGCIAGFNQLANIPSCIEVNAILTYSLVEDTNFSLLFIIIVDVMGQKKINTVLLSVQSRKCHRFYIDKGV